MIGPLAVTRPPPEGEEGRKVWAGRPRGPKTRLEDCGSKEDACQTLVKLSTFRG
jgi:hypothetical protein